MKTAAELSRFYVRIFAITALAVAAASILASHLIYNATESLPLGLYWLSRGAEPKRNELVAFPIPNNVRELVHERRYLPDGAYIVKPVVALPGDQVCLRDSLFTVNGELVGAVLRQDAAGRPLPRYDVCDTVAPTQVFVASRHPRSFDSRTFGPVSRVAVQGTVTPLWTF